MTASHYNRKQTSFLKAQWYRYDQWNGYRYPQSAVLTWFSIGDKQAFSDRMENPQAFTQALGEFLYKEFHVTKEHSW